MLKGKTPYSVKKCYDLKLKQNYDFGLYLLISIYLNTGMKLPVNFVTQSHCQRHYHFI